MTMLAEKKSLRAALESVSLVAKAKANEPTGKNEPPIFNGMDES